MLLGRTEPRLWTPPLRELTPETSIGFDQVEFARDVLRHPADPWQEWLFIHAGELLPDGITPRFRIVLVLVSRQNGKTECVVILAAYWMFVDEFPLILGTSTKLEYARETWDKTRKLVERTEALDDLRNTRRWYVRGNNNQEMWTRTDSRYKIAASTEDGPRSLTIDRLVADELRQHHDYSAWNAAEPAASPWHAQIWALSNAGDDKSVVLNELRQEALTFIETGVGNERIGLFEWSAPEGADPTDLNALAQANPNLGLRKDPAELLAKARGAVAKGGEALTGFKTEYMCIRVRMLNPAIDPGAWTSCEDVGDLDAVRNRVAVVLDVAPDQLHATLYAAAMLDDERVRVDFVKAWDGIGCTDQARRDLPELLAQVKPRIFGWLPSGPGAALAADLARPKGKNGKPVRAKWLPRGTEIVEITSDLAAVCMGFAEQVTAHRLAHSGDPLLNAHVAGAEKLPRGDTWVFSRRGDGHVDAVYAAAGATHLARTLPPPAPRPLVLVGRRPG